MGTPLQTSGLFEGDYIETMDGLFFAVKGLFHPEGRVIAYLRYVPDSMGDRVRGENRYKRVYDIEETTKLLEEEYPQYLSRVWAVGRTLQTVNLERIARVYRPRDRLLTLISRPRTELENILSKFVNTLSAESDVQMTKFGISGSILINLASSFSDIDLIAYGREAGWKVYNGLKRLRETQEWICPYDSETVSEILKARWGYTGLDIEKLVDIEAGKVLHGRVCGRDYFMRLVKGIEEVEVEQVSRPVSEVKLRAVVAGADDSIFTPCTYQVTDCEFIDAPRLQEVSELASFRGKFTEQVEKGETVEARGTLEEVRYEDRTIHRVMLEKKGDYLIPI